MTPSDPLRIAVVGAGPAGLTFASVLQRKAKELARDGRVVPWTVTLYEAESADSRRVGGSLDLGKTTGLAALVAAGLWNRFHDFARPEGQEVKLMDHRGNLVYHHEGAKVTSDSDAYNPEIDRYDLNRILYESLPPDAIQWDRKLDKVRPLEQGGGYELVFADGSTATADLVVGADGAWSRVRPLLTDQRPQYGDAAATFLDITIRDFDERYPELADLIGQGTLYGFGGGTMLVGQRNSHGIVHVHVGIKAPADWRKHELLSDATDDQQRVVTLVKQYYADWGETLRKLTLAAAMSVGDEGHTLLAWPLYAMPVGVTWDHRSGVTVIGDAAHLMSPCAGEGVNTAMVDALKLAEAVASPLSGDIQAMDFENEALAAVAKFESEMFDRAQTPAKRSADNLALFFGDEEMTPEHAARLFLPKYEASPPGVA